MKTTYCTKTGDIVLSRTTESVARRMDYMHLHPHCEILFLVSETRMAFRRDGAETEVQGPCVIYAPAYAMHAANVIEGLPYDRYVLYFDESSSGKQTAEPSFWLLPLKAEEVAYLIPYFERMLPGVSGEEEIPLLLSLILAVLRRYADESGRTLIHGERHYIQSIVRYISEHFAEPLTTPEIARRFLINRNKLNRDFRSYTMMTVRQFITEVRINHAKQLLRDGHSVADSAIECGFSDAGYFIAVFRRICGITPAEYARQRRSAVSDTDS